jgi:DNA-binding transcriptional LysR family regulator
MRLRHIEAFNAVMLTGSVRDAAKLINVTQSAVSRVLQHAELQLGFPLFTRQKGRLVPTSEALTLYGPVDRLFRQLEEVQRLAESLKAGQSAQKLRVLAALTLTRHVLPLAIDLFRADFPNLPISVAALHSGDIVASLALQEADVGFAFSDLIHPALQGETVAEGEMVCIAPKGVLSAELIGAGVVQLSDIAGESMIGIDVRDPIGLLLSRACREAGVGLQPHIVVQTYHAALSMAEHGLGIAVVDTFTAMSAKRDMVDVLLLDPRIPVTMKALRPKGLPASRAGDAFVRCVRQAASLVMPPAVPRR